MTTSQQSDGSLAAPSGVVARSTLLDQPKWLLGITAVVLSCGVYLAVASYGTERRAASVPRMTCDEFVRKGANAPRFVTLTDVRLASHGHAFRRDMDADMEMYIPFYPARLVQEPPPADLDLLLDVLDDRVREHLSNRLDMGELTVEQWTTAASLEPWARAQLTSLYPGIPLARCRVLSVGLHEPSLLRARGEMQSGVTLTLIAVALQIAWLLWAWLKTAWFPATSDLRPTDAKIPA